MKNNILLIYPQDETTDFLQRIPNFLFKRNGEDRFIYQRLGFSDVEHLNCIKMIEQLPDDSFVIFLGHGRSDQLLGALDYERFRFVNHELRYIFKSKKVFFLSCRSREFLLDQGIEGVGFGNLLTSTSELNDPTNQRHYSYLYSAIGTPDSFAIQQFNEQIVNISCTSLHDYIAQNLSMEELYFNLKLRFNKVINKLIREFDPPSVRNVANLLYEAKTEMRLFK